MNQRLSFWWWWLVSVVCGVIIFSLGLVIAPNTLQQFFNAIFFSKTQTPVIVDEAAKSYIKFVYGVLGAVMIGWMVSLLSILIGSYRRKQREAWYGIALSVFVWFIVDTSFSILAGFWQNAVFNTIFFVLLIIPLVATYHYFNSHSQNLTPDD